MTLGSSSPHGLPEDILATLDRFCVEGIGRDGLRPRTGESIGSFTFSGNTITRTSGSWITDGLSAGQIVTVVGSTSNNGVVPFNVTSVDGLVLTFRTNVSFMSEGPTADVSISSEHPDTSFAIYFGPQWHDHWATPPCVWFRVTSATRQDLKTFHTATRQRTAIDCFGWRLEVRIWGSEPVTTEPPTSYRHDIDRLRPAYEIFENVARVIRQRGPGYVQFPDVPGWENETSIQRFGEELAFASMIPIPIYDYQKPALPSGLELKFGSGVPLVVAPGEV